MQDTNEIQNPRLQTVYDVYEIFQNFFGEEYVDLQNLPTEEDLQEEECGVKPIIYIWWPSVTVTNEHDRSVEIQDLYAKVEITMEGQIPYENVGFQLDRSTFTDIQFASGYIHSHVPGRYSGLRGFQNPCLGTGPIKNTIADLKNGYEEALWMLFCQELSLYVTVESLTGGPYRRLEEIGSTKIKQGYDKFEDKTYSDLYGFYDSHDEVDQMQFNMILKEFTDYYLQHGHLALSYRDGKYQCGMSYFDFIIDISNCFIDWFNLNGSQDAVPGMYSKKFLVPCFVSDGKFFENKTLADNDSNLEGTRILTFKGQDILLRLIRSIDPEQQTTLLLNHKIAMFILHSILRIINYHYTNERNNTNKQSGDTTGSPAPTYQTASYL